MYKILVSTALLSPYRVDWLNELGKTEDVTIFCLSEEDREREAEWLKKRPKTCKCVLMKGMVFPKLGKISLDFIKELKLNSYDIIILDGYGFTTQIINILYLNKQKLRYFVNIDGIIKKDHESKVAYMVKKNIIRKFPFCLCGSKSTNSILAHYGIRESHIINHPFSSLYASDIALDVASLDEKMKIRRKIGINESKVIISVGRFTYLGGYGKGYDVLLRTAAKMSRQIGWYIIGGKPTEEFKKMTSENNLENVHYIDFLDKEHLKEFYRASDVFVLMTVGDVWGLVVNEAMASGLPVITTEKCVAGLDLVENEKNGYIIPVGSDIELKNKLEIILSDSNILSRMSKKSLDVIKNYTIENMVQVHKDAFDTIISTQSD